MDANPRSVASANALVTPDLMISGEDLQKRVRAATWMMPRKGNLPALVSLASPGFSMPNRVNSRKG